MTRQRQIILNVITRSCEHLTAEQIYAEAKREYPAIALGTVYRNLGLLCDSGEIMRVHVPGEADRYDRNPVPHCHAKCEKCGKMLDIDLPDLKQDLVERTGLDITDYSVTVKYVCPECKKKK